jgi:hypothetical protein
VKQTIFLFCLVLLFAGVKAQYWQQQVNYTIDVSLDDTQKSLKGFAKITYINNSPDTLHFIWFHLWPNAYKNDKTAFSDQLLENGNTSFYFSDKDQRGYINQLDFKIGGITAKMEDHPQHIDIVKILLPSPLPPNQQIQISTPFFVKLPQYFSRSGYDKKSWMLTQWYPKPAVYDRLGWHPMPYLDQGEFYSEFGNYDVRITVPADYVVAATGVLQNNEEQLWLKNRTLVKPVEKPVIKRQSTPKSSPKVEKGNGSITSRQKAAMQKTSSKPEIAIAITNEQNGSKTLQFIQNNVHDFAWFANKEFIVKQDTCRLASGKVVKVYSYYTSAYERLWNKSIGYAKDALRFYSDSVGEYPYETLSIVQGPKSNAGGMEYPTITIISPGISDKQLDIVLAHEIGHNWFYGILATNERTNPWMDEGLNTFYERKYTEMKYGEQPQWEELAFQTFTKKHLDQAISTASEQFSEMNYGLISYYKTAKWLEWIEERMGKKVFQQAIAQYYSQWQFKHPQPEDLQKAFSPFLNGDTTETFNYLKNKGILPDQQLSGLKVITPLQPKSVIEFAKNPTKDALIISPAIGYNVYDRFMIGGLISNYKLPPTSFQFLTAPLYATGSKKLNGLGKISYSFFPDKNIKKVELFTNVSTFSMNEFTDGKNENHYFSFRKLVPGAELQLKEKDPRSTRNKFIQWKSYFISEDRLRISFDSVFENGDTFLIDVANKVKENFTIHQLKLGIEDNRALYPYTVNATLQGTNNILRIALEGNYFFNYKEGGLSVRLFAGKLFYKQEKEFEVDRFALNMSGPNGEEDYTYSDYFIGRNRFEGLASQQIMIRDGGFKIRTELLSDKVGRTNNWLTAVNFNSTIPSRLNPFSILPVKIPIRLFADIGTYAEAWSDQESNRDKFLFDAGIHIPLFNETINIYFPLIYSNAFTEYVKSIYPKNRLLKTMTFSIDINNIPKKVRKGIF